MSSPSFVLKTKVKQGGVRTKKTPSVKTKPGFNISA